MNNKCNHYKENAWWASPYNDEPDVLATINRTPKVEIHDATLRDGEQTPGVEIGRASCRERVSHGV